jgi:lipopolysaccharide export system protein LptA
MKRFAAALGVAFTLCVGGAQAQISTNRGDPIDISGDNMEVVDAQRMVAWKGRVEALQGNNRLRADAINIYYGPGTGPRAENAAPGTGWGDIDRIEAVGNVYFVTPEQVARGEKGVYTAASDTIVITGDVVVAQGENVLRGDVLTIEVGAGRSTMDAGPGGGPGERVRGVFYPKKSDGAGR